MVKSVAVLGGAAIFAAVCLHGCGGGGDGSDAEPKSPTTTGPEEPTSTTTSPEVCAEGQTRFGNQGCFYKCESDLEFAVTAPSQKGLALDDTTLHFCPGKMHFHWPNTNEPVTSFRMFKAWQSTWNETGLSKEAAWQELARFLKASEAKVLVGTQITCNASDDDLDWQHVKEMMKIFGPEQIMGLAIGNELELLWQKEGMTEACLNRIWNEGYFLDKFYDRVRELDALGKGFRQVKVTSVFGGFILAAYPFYDQSTGNQIARILPFLQNVTGAFGERYAHTLNIYSYFEESLVLDSDGSGRCDQALAVSKCFEAADPKDCIFTSIVSVMRERLDNLGSANSLLWIGETGWSYPQARTLHTPMRNCGDWSTSQTMAEYYSNFLSWDMSITGKYRGPDHVFYFTMRDSENFDIPEGFGLVGDCTNTTCKLQKSSWTGPTTALPTTDPAAAKIAASAGIGLVV